MFRLLATFEQGALEFPVPEPGGEARLGSDPANDLFLPVAGVSHVHALIRRCPGGVEIVDLGSKNKLDVEGQQQERAVLTPGLGLQIGRAWLELLEVSAVDAPDPADPMDRVERASAPPAANRATTELQSLRPLPEASAEEAIRLVLYLDRMGAGPPGERPALLARLRAALGAGTLASLEVGRRGRVVLRESVGEPLSDPDLAHLSQLLHHEPGAWSPLEARLRRSGRFLIAGRDRWYLSARFADPTPARVRWRKDFMRLLPDRLFPPIRDLDLLKVEEIERAVAVTGSKRLAARLLGISRQTVINLLAARRTPPVKSK